jgi:hypothetical protein
MGSSIGMTVRSKTAGPPRVRFVRSDAVAAGAVSVTLTGAEVLVTYGAAAVVGAGGPMAPRGGGPATPALVVTAGDLELAVSGEARLAEPDPAADFEAMWRRASAMAVDEGATEVSAALVVHEAEWEPLADDGPTRLLPLVELPVVTAPPRAERTNPSARSAKVMSRERRRIIVRRVALVSMLVCAFALAMHARRLHARRVAAIEEPRGPALAVKPASSASDWGPAAEQAALTTLRDAPSERIAHPKPSLAVAGGGSKARAAADALANGAYAEALALYQDLAAENEANPAYARVIQLLRARVDSKSVHAP